jgi:hypothetical protein
MTRPWRKKKLGEAVCSIGSVQGELDQLTTTTLHGRPRSPHAGAIVPTIRPTHRRRRAATETTPPPQQQQRHPSFHDRPLSPPPGTYIIQVPKDQVLRVPPPDRVRRYKKLAARPARRRLLRRACCFSCSRRGT